MYYFAETSIMSSFEALKGNVENKFLGILGILKCINSDFAEPNITYQITDGELACWLDDMCYLKDYEGNYGSSNLYVKLSNYWSEYVGSEFFQKSSNIYNMIIFAYRYKGFIAKPSNTELIAMFCKDYHLSQDIVQQWFDCTSIEISYSESATSKNKCKVLFGITNDTISFSSPFSVAARAGELSRAPFVQTLYAGMDSIKCLLILRDNIDEYYNTKNTRNMRTTAVDYTKFRPYLTALRTKPFMLLAGISGTGKSRIVRKLAQATVTEELQRADGYTGTDFANDRWTQHSPANFELIQVKPNWHNSMDVIGYLSNIPSPHYVFTPFIEFIVKAWQHPDVPFFLCLDEMNLAPVEEYFAEFLSAIESRSFEGDEYVTDPIVKPFNSFGTAKDEKDTEINIGDMMINTLFPNFKASDTETPTAKVIKHFRTRGLTLPKNLIVIGTVNMDETTFSFSRKVLDRAMSVEMNEVDYDTFLTDTTDDDLKAIVKAFEENGDTDLNTLLVDRHIEAKEIIDELGEDARLAIDYLKRINALLEGTPFKLGYRAANEALIYLQSANEFGQSDRIAALDNFTLMKVLSRIEGDETKLKITNSEADKERIANAGVNVDKAKLYGDLNILTALRNIIMQMLGDSNYDGAESNTTEETATESEEGMISTELIKKELQSIKKIDSMISQLKRDHFVSYWN